MRLQRQFQSAIRRAAEPRLPTPAPGAFASTRVSKALRLLLRADHYSRELERTSWDFAVEIDALHGAGLTNNDLRWLVCKGYVAHARETTLSREESRSFRPQRGLIFNRRTCFVLTEGGVLFARGTLRKFRRSRARQATQLGNGTAAEAQIRLRPRWDRDRQELRLGSAVVKQFKVLAMNQERILAAFEEEGWPVRIDDPLPPQLDQDPKRRLHDTINALNRNQQQRLIRFSGDGTGQGIRWAVVMSGTNGHGALAGQ